MIREKVAEALLSIEDSWNDHTWDQLPDTTQAMFLTQADAAILAVMEALQTPTEAMKGAGRAAWLESASDYTLLYESMGAVWKAMLDVAQQENVK